MENTKGLICPQCGSTDLLLITESLAKCKHCATNLQIIKDKTEQRVTILYQKESAGSLNFPKINFLNIKTKTTLTDFTRTAYVDLFTSDTPTSICDAEFLPSKTETRFYTLVSGKYDIKYSANIGFNHTEKYLGEETYYVEGKKHTKLVEKERVVTNWAPTSGSYVNGCNVFLLCDNENHSIKEEQNYTSEFVNKIAPNFKEDVEEIDTEDGSVTPYVPTNDNINKAYKQGASIVSENCRVGLGGDKIKDFNYTYEVRPDVIAGVTSKDYILPFNINNRKSEIVSHPNKINTTFINVVTDNTEKTIYDNNYKNSKKSLFIPIVACYLFWFVSILICSIMVTGFSFDVLELNLAIAFFVSIIPSIAFVIIWTGIHKKVWENRTENQTELALYERDVKKYNTLQAKLKELGFNPLSQEEKDRFKHLEIKSKKQNKFLSLMERFILWLEKLSFKKKKQEKGISEC